MIIRDPCELPFYGVIDLMFILPELQIHSYNYHNKLPLLHTQTSIHCLPKSYLSGFSPTPTTQTHCMLLKLEKADANHHH